MGQGRYSAFDSVPDFSPDSRDNLASEVPRFFSAASMSALCQSASLIINAFARKDILYQDFNNTFHLGMLPAYLDSLATISAPGPFMPSLFSNDYRTFIALLTRVRVVKGITQRELASALRITQASYSKIESCERRLDSVEAHRICELLGISQNWVLDRLQPRFKPLRPGRDVSPESLLDPDSDRDP